MTLSKEHTIGFVTSKDGTKIGFRKLGSGSGLILVHGGMMTSQNLMKLAELLSNEFTVYIPDRRGRGLSGPHGNSYNLSAETEDMQALINNTKTQNIFGLSSGAIIALQTAIVEETIKKVALYEPPIPVNGTKPAAWVDKYELAMSKGNLGEALISIVRGTGDSSLLSILPSFITIPFMNMAIKADTKDKETKMGNEVPLKTLISTMHFDPKVVFESEGIINKCKDISADVLLLGGQRSQDYLKIALDALSSALPLSKRIEFSGMGHLAAENGGNPKVVAKELLSFFRTTNIK
jgi:pimeloyl-ACP methyl ester carboxylesterase